MSSRTICLETGEIYPSQAAAARKTGISKHAVYKAVRTGMSAGGYHFYRDGERLDREHFADCKNGVHVRCIETGEEFETIGQAAKAKGCSQRILTAVVNGSCGGYHWELIRGVKRRSAESVSSIQD